MSQATVRQCGASPTQNKLDDLLGRLPDLASAAATQYVNLLRSSARLAGEVLPAGLMSRPDPCCTVPTQDCPPRCVAQIDWVGCACEQQRAVVTVRNSGEMTRQFTFAAGSLGPAKVVVEPASAQLAPGEAVAVQLTVPPSDAFTPGETYRSELLIRGAYEQCVSLALTVTAPALATLEVCQGEVPQRTTELNWYRHWQCTEPCVTPQRPGGNVVGNVAAGEGAASLDQGRS